MNSLIKYLSEIYPEIFPEVIAGIIVLLILLPIIKVILSHTASINAIKLKKLELLLSIFNNNEELNSQQKFIAEHLIFSIYKVKVDFRTISALFSSKSPIKSFDLYMSARYYVKLTSKSKPFRRVKRFKSFKVFNFPICYWVSIKEFLIYLASMSTALFSLLIFGAISVNFPTEPNYIVLCILLMITAFTFFIAFGFIGLHYLKREGGIRTVTELLKLQLTSNLNGTKTVGSVPLRFTL